MTTTFQLPANTLDQSFLDRVKAMFRERRIAITISDEPDSMEASQHLRDLILNEDTKELQRVIEAQQRLAPEVVKAYQERISALRGSLAGIDTTVERDVDRV
jgi:hypothetical protein